MSLLRESIEDRLTRVSVGESRAFNAIVLAGTHTWRRNAFDRLLPRPVLPVAQLPLLSYPLGWLRAFGASHVSVCANGLAPQLRTHLEPLRHMLPPLEFVDDETPRGAAGSARDAALTMDGDLFVVADATTIPAVDLHRVIEEHEASCAAVTIIVQPREHGSLDALIPTGLYVFSRRAFELVPATGYQDIKESLIPRLYAADELVLTSEAERPCPQVLDATTYLAANHRMIARSVAQAAAFGHSSIESRTVIHPSARVDRSALVIGPVIVGAGAVIRDNAVVVGPASIDAGSTIEAGALVSRSVIWSDCTVGAHASVDRSVLSTGVSVRSGARLVGAIQIDTRPPRSRKAPVRVPIRPREPVVNARGLAFR